MNFSPINIPEKDRNSSRSNLHFLPKKTLYVVDGVIDNRYDYGLGGRTDIIRFVLEDVRLIEYNKETQWEEAKVITEVDHVTVIRKRQNTLFTKLPPGTRVQLIGEIVDYQASDAKSGGFRRTLKVYSDTNFKKMILEVYRRIQSAETNYEDFEPDALLKQLNKTEKLIEEIELKANTYDYVPRLTQTQLLYHVKVTREKLTDVRNRDQFKVLNQIDDLLASL